MRHHIYYSQYNKKLKNKNKQKNNYRPQSRCHILQCNTKVYGQAKSFFKMKNIHRAALKFLHYLNYQLKKSYFEIGNDCKRKDKLQNNQKFDVTKDIAQKRNISILRSTKSIQYSMVMKSNTRFSVHNRKYGRFNVRCFIKFPRSLV